MATGNPFLSVPPSTKSVRGRSGLRLKCGLTLQWLQPLAYERERHAETKSYLEVDESICSCVCAYVVYVQQSISILLTRTWQRAVICT